MQSIFKFYQLSQQYPLQVFKNQNPIKNQALPLLSLQSPSIQNRPPAFQPFKTLTILKSAGLISEIYYASEFVCFLVMSFMSCILTGMFRMAEMVKPSQCLTSEGTCQFVLLLDHLVKPRSARFLQCKVNLFFLFIVSFSYSCTCPS